MSHDTYPYEVGQTVILYIQKNTDENVEGKLIIRSGDSRVLDGPLCDLGTSYQEDLCVKNSIEEPVHLEISFAISSSEECFP